MAATAQAVAQLQLEHAAGQEDGQQQQQQPQQREEEDGAAQAPQKMDCSAPQSPRQAEAVGANGAGGSAAQSHAEASAAGPGGSALLLPADSGYLADTEGAGSSVSVLLGGSSKKGEPGARRSARMQAASSMAS
jgi:hypothetical protein